LEGVLKTALPLPQQLGGSATSGVASSLCSNEVKISNIRCILHGGGSSAVTQQQQQHS
jgi:hypothetical protein